MTRSRLSTFMFVFTALWLLLFAVGCTADWTSQASNIIVLLPAAIASAIGILAAFGKGIPADVLAKVNDWAAKATTALAEVRKLIDEYNAAPDTAKASILLQIQEALSLVANEFNNLLPLINVSDPATQENIMVVFQAIQSEINALVALVPAIQGKVKTHKELRALTGAVKGPDVFREDFNSKAITFGEKYTI